MKGEIRVSLAALPSAWFIIFGVYFEISRDLDVSHVTGGEKARETSMKLLCEVETVFILAQASGCACKNQKSRASLTIGRKPESDEVLLVVSTVKNVPGIKYKVTIIPITMMYVLFSCLF